MALSLTSQSRNDLSRTATALQDLRAMETAAHNINLAAPGTVPSGLQLAGLVPDSGLAASGIANPAERPGKFATEPAQFRYKALSWACCAGVTDREVAR